MLRSLLAALVLPFALSACASAPDASTADELFPDPEDAAAVSASAEYRLDATIQAYPLVVEICDGIDNDLDEVTDEDCGECDTFVSRPVGFWREEACVMDGSATGESLLPLTVGEHVLDTSEQVTRALNRRTNGDAQYVLGKQILAARLNVAAFGIGDVSVYDMDQDGVYETVSEMLAAADAIFDSGTEEDRIGYAIALARVNNAGRDEGLWFDDTCSTAPEVCNEVDDDGDGAVDEDCRCEE